jgi:hypothetical protein
MVHNVSQGPIGGMLGQMEESLTHLETLPLDQLTGSEARTLLAILADMLGQVSALQSKIQQLWELRS